MAAFKEAEGVMDWATELLGRVEKKLKRHPTVCKVVDDSLFQLVKARATVNKLPAVDVVVLAEQDAPLAEEVVDLSVSLAKHAVIFTWKELTPEYLTSAFCTPIMVEDVLTLKEDDDGKPVRAAIAWID